MKYRLPPVAVILLLGMLVLAARPLKAETLKERFSWSLGGSIFWFAEDNGKQGSDPAAVLPSPGVAVAFHIWGPFSIELTEDLYFTNYEYNAAKQYPMACNPENRSAFVFGLLTGLQGRALFPIGGKGIQARAYFGPAADFRIVALAIGLHGDDFTGKLETDAQMQTDAIRSHFWSKGRWLMPVIGGGMDFPISEKFLVGFDFRVWMPIYRLWADKDIPAVDGWRFGLGLRVTPR